MQIIEMQLNKFFLDEGGPYLSNNVEIDYSENGSIHLSCDVPGLVLKDMDITVNLFSDHSNLCDFVYEYVITSVNDLNIITPELMLKRFLVGRGDLYCYLDPDLEFYLSFRRKGRCLIAKDPDKKLHEVPLSVKTPEEIVIYTQHYYEKLFA